MMIFPTLSSVLQALYLYYSVFGYEEHVWMYYIM